LIGVVFDIDGVLINSYNGIEYFYRRVLPQIIDIDQRLIDYLIELEYIGELTGLLREDWWFKYIPGLTEELYDKLITRYWEVRIENSKLEPGVINVLEYLANSGYRVFTVSYRDDIYGLKKYRIELMDLDKFFHEIIIVGEDFHDRVDGLKYLVKKYDLNKTFYIDDKPLNLLMIYIEMKQKPVLIHYRFKHNIEYPWINPEGYSSQ